MTMNIYVTLGEYLENHNLSAYRLAKQLEGKTAKGSVYALARGDVRRIDLETLASIMQALEQLTGECVSFDDLLERSDLETAAIIDEHPDLLERIAKLERGEVKLIPWEKAERQLNTELVNA
jgi:DNA-binding Xre family transcriptional regulator